MTDKDRLLNFINHLVPDNFVCGDFSLTFNDDGSAVISIANPDDAEETDEEDKPHKVSMVVCLNCGKRWVAVRPQGTKLTDLECPQCHTQGAATETGEELEDDGE